MNNSELNQRRLAATPRGVGVMCDFFAAKAENATLWDVEGHEYIDFSAGIAVLNTGHRHPKILAAVREQLECFTHTAYQVVPYGSYITLAERINAIAPIHGPAKTTFFTTGAEAVENAVKIARAYTKRPGVIAFNAAFHGRTLLTMTLTGKVAPYSTGFGPFPGSIFHAVYPSEHNGVTVEQSLENIDRLLHTDIAADQVAAILLEPVQGEGGFNVAPPEFISALRKLCDEHGILLIADEVQSGFARTGKVFAMEYYEEKADLITMAKSLGGGFPISGVVGRADVMDAPGPGGLGGTYAGNPLAVASALAVLDVIEDEKLCQRAQQLGATLVETLRSLKAKCPAIVDIRARGSMVAVEFNDPQTGKPSAEITKTFQKEALNQGLLLLTCGVHGNVIRFLYPLTIPDAQFSKALDILTRVLTQ
ncbi:4-aminobutyrate--2-oxoglutarate transaminase [Pectobacteriaceae bacterium CE70]|uniref:4-aminobutyrate--2-oxoglutarate transaminase n=1 Tax=Serratia sp. (strain ATCC 39006) TaxID=104623 RepID=A0A2I5T7P4_SERS3|nr:MULTISPECIES: 4-aminobutyrate--2-oxoglutarate transaminase [Enterobacterales]WJV60726.1 4-aminobutyrate--2-oxoglutarate transaminase [Pectobacteriaceae bacterium C52]WJV68832.1 4-aminobutyrate--2-oxoglutarate transaminase [Pectobacteriaceae bacterium CE70]WJY12755.1 4-aminobutyrate--2-oxoglutarate transaminase [Pectobacteriaceae bacterium C80]AUH00593.1 4-aminobutyrate--2-oxoglutarate transaminase [Serratia sp. ATCC 39006]AUH04914.1 4-aminobutyrate--2-oxoglutarate transaminase [Serratia sp.